jgi:hypothetical protein
MGRGVQGKQTHCGWLSSKANRPGCGSTPGAPHTHNCAAGCLGCNTTGIRPSRRGPARPRTLGVDPRHEGGRHEKEHNNRPHRAAGLAAEGGLSGGFFTCGGQLLVVGARLAGKPAARGEEGGARRCREFCSARGAFVGAAGARSVWRVPRCSLLRPAGLPRDPPARRAPRGRGAVGVAPGVGAPRDAAQDFTRIQAYRGVSRRAGVFAPVSGVRAIRRIQFSLTFRLYRSIFQGEICGLCDFFSALCANGWPWMATGPPTIDHPNSTAGNATSPFLDEP